MPEPIILYDIPRRAATPKDNAWSPNTWKARYALNIKGLPYKTVWVEYPDIEALYNKLSLAAVDTSIDGTPYCSLPVIHDPNTHTTVNDSAAIAAYLDKTYPQTQQLIPAETAAFHAAFNRAFLAVFLAGKGGDYSALMMPVTYAALNPASQGYFRRTREKWFGTTIEEMAPRGSERRRKHWEGVKRGFHEVAGWLEADGEPERLFFQGGETVCYADVVLAAWLVWLRNAFGEASEEWRDVLTWDGGRWGRFAEAFRKHEFVDVGTLFQL